MNRGSSIEPVWVDSPDLLSKITSQWTSETILALDTEFVREKTFYPRPGLIQVFDGSACYLIDPVKISDLEPLKTVLADSTVLKVMHSFGEDLEVFRVLFDEIPCNLLDTQIGGAFAGLGGAMGYQPMVQSLLDVSLEKEGTRSDWTARPLTASQIHYAAEDVIYLRDLFFEIRQRLEARQLYQAFVEECDFRVESLRNVPPAADYYLKLRGAWNLEESSQRLLKALVEWRENIARRKDLPRSRVVSDKALIEIVTRMPESTQQLGVLEGVGPATIRRYGDFIVQKINSFVVDQGEHFDRIARPLPKRLKTLYSALKTCVTQVSEETKLAPEILAKKSVLEQLVLAIDHCGVDRINRQECPVELVGWRWEIIGEKLLERAKTIS